MSPGAGPGPEDGTPAGGAARFPAAFYVLVPVLAAALPLVALELGLALFAPVPFASEVNMYYIPDPHTGFLHKPDSVGHYPGGKAFINGLGHRDDEAARRKADGVFRILVLGDSFTVGANVEQDEPYAQVLERRLRGELGDRVEVLNAGVGAWNPFQYAQYFEFHGRAFDPDLVVVGFFVGNDSYVAQNDPGQLRTAVAGRRVSREKAAAQAESLTFKIYLYQRSNLARWWLNRGAVVFDQGDVLDDGSPRDGGRFSEKYLAIQGRRFKRNHLGMGGRRREKMENCVLQVGRIQELAARDGVPVVVLLIPDENQINRSLAEAVWPDEQPARFDLDMPQTLLLAMFAERGLPLVDPRPAFLAHPDRLYMNDTHWNAEGHRVAADALVDALRPRVARALGDVEP
ncbi:MAG: SGNH/GDSL hydrolase family protein [Acidobacteriota bacterium]